MSVYLKSNFFIQSVLAFTVIPLLIWAMGNLFERSLLKESLSVLTILFISMAAWHVIDLGRHSNLAMSILFIIASAGSVLPLLKTYTFKKFKKTSEV